MLSARDVPPPEVRVPQRQTHSIRSFGIQFRLLRSASRFIRSPYLLLPRGVDQRSSSCCANGGRLYGKVAGAVRERFGRIRWLLGTGSFLGRNAKRSKAHRRRHMI